MVAFLKAQGYRSAELYLSAAMRRHKTHHDVDGPLSLASKEAVQMALRGRGLKMWISSTVNGLKLGYSPVHLG